MYSFITRSTAHIRGHFYPPCVATDHAPVSNLIRKRERKKGRSRRGQASGARLASHRGSKTGGHSHGTRTHQQVLVMDVTLGLKVRVGGDKRKEGGVWRWEGGAGRDE